MQTEGLYVHIPFCLSRCDYCSFVSFPVDKAPDKYIDALIHHAELMANHPLLSGKIYSSLFIGGGTPTIYSGEQLADIIYSCLNFFKFTKDPEITVEANPNTINVEKLEIIKEVGANRLSIGVQSFSDEILVGIGRTHTRGQAVKSLEIAGYAGFENVNIDLIYGLPGQAVMDVQKSLRSIIAFKPEHVSLYELMVEPGTPLAKKIHLGKTCLPDEDLVADMEKTAHGMLADNGYKQYEVSNFARTGFECRHNINYWQNNSYVGLGAAAVSYINGLRIKNVQDPEQYMQIVEKGCCPYSEVEGLSVTGRFRESVIMGLRMIEGVSMATLKERFAIDPREYYGYVLVDFQRRGLVDISGERMRLTKKGLPVANQVLSQLV